MADEPPPIPPGPPPSDPDTPCPDGLDPRVWRAMLAMNRFAEQDENGVDLSTLRNNLALTWTQRIRRASRMARGLRHARDQYRRTG
ncbi:MAG: hypothetical protein AAF800_06915 [Planctomycetota bacterium]